MVVDYNKRATMCLQNECDGQKEEILLTSSFAQTGFITACFICSTCKRVHCTPLTSGCQVSSRRKHNTESNNSLPAF